jgi:hypothetical protein
MTYLTAEGALALEEFLREQGFLKGLRRGRARAVCEDLAGLVNCLVAGAVLQATEQMRSAVVLAGQEAIERQRAGIFESLFEQLGCQQYFSCEHKKPLSGARHHGSVQRTLPACLPCGAHPSGAFLSLDSPTTLWKRNT